MLLQLFWQSLYEKLTLHLFVYIYIYIHVHASTLCIYITIISFDDIILDTSI